MTTTTATELFFALFWNERSGTSGAALATSLVVVAVLGLASTADAAASVEARTSDDLVAQPISLVYRLGPPPAGPSPLLTGMDLELYHSHAMAPDGFELRFALDRATTFFLSADLDAELPRLDSVDGDTYFKVGFELSLTPSLRVLVEDFMSATAVTGHDDEELLSRPAWDGHQIALGAEYDLTPSLSLRAELRGYVLSETDRDDGVGGAAALSWRF